MRCAILGFAAGAALLHMQAALPQPSTLVALAAMAVLLLFLRGLVHGVVRAGAAGAAGALCGFCWAALLAQTALAPQLSKLEEGVDIVIVGTVDSLPYRFDGGVRFNFAVEEVIGAPSSVPPRVSLAWYAAQRGSWSGSGSGSGQGSGLRAVPTKVQPGQRWRLTVRLQRPHGNANPHGFDYEVWLLEQGVRATGYVRTDGAEGAKGDERANNRLLADFVPGFRHSVEYCRATLRARIERALPGRAYAGVIVALVVGDQRGIGQADWDVFNRTGIGHLISISGLHITMVAGLFALAVSALWRRSFFTQAQLPLLLPAQKVAALTGATVALLYVLLAGFGIPAQRTLYMLCVVAAALWSGRIAAVSHVLCASLALVVLLDPWSVLSPGFWLSFGAVAAILFASVGRTGARGAGWVAALRLGAQTQYAVTVALVPLTMLLFAQVSLVSPLANAVAIPLVSFVVTPLALAGSLLPAPLSTLLLQLAHLAIEALAWLLGWLGAQRFAVWSAPAPVAWVFVFALAGTVWLLAPRGWPLRWLGAVAWLPLLAGQPSRPPEGQVAIIAFDVGQGMALLIETHGHRLLYDTGPAYSPESNGANRVILPYLKARGIAAVDGVIVSHSDIDHSGGALTLLEAMPVAWVWSSLWPEHPIVHAAARHGRCVGGQSWVWDGVVFELLQPSAASYADAALKPNARGCTLRIRTATHAVLLAADIEAVQESALVVRQRGMLRADVLLAPHHGSGTSSTEAFLAAVRPSVAVFQVGYRNRYRHPKKEVLDRYARLGIARLRTDEAGAILFDSSDGFTPRAYRVEHARYWYGR